jgi:hypothetical protein
MQWLRDNVVCADKLIYSNATTFNSTAAGSPGTMSTFSIPAGLIAQTTEGIQIEAWGSTGATANNKQIKLLWGATTIFDSAAAAANAKPWFATAKVVRNAAGGATAISWGYHNGALVAPAITALTSQDFTAAISVLSQYTAATADADVVQNAFLVRFWDQLNMSTFV